MLLGPSGPRSLVLPGKAFHTETEDLQNNESSRLLHSESGIAPSGVLSVKDDRSYSESCLARTV